MNSKKLILSKVDIRSKNECWNWLGAINKDGYGRICYNGTHHFSHRLVLSFFHPRKKLDGKIVMHICDNTKCCNPKHLVVGSHVDNQMDKVRKNRQAKGEKNGQSILTEQQVRAARKKYKPHVVTYQMIANEYGVSKDTIQKAIRGIYWKHL